MPSMLDIDLIVFISLFFKIISKYAIFFVCSSV